MNSATSISRKTTTIAFTFVNKPSPEMREALKRKGFRFENGNWYLSETTSQFADDKWIDDFLNQ